MDKYTKGRNVEEELRRSAVPMEDVGLAAGEEAAAWFTVRGGTRAGDGLLEAAVREVTAGRGVLWSGRGAGARRAVACAEQLKRRLRSAPRGPLHQVTRACWSACDEHWLPRDPDSGLDELVVRRRVPTIHVLITPLHVDPNTPGYQLVHNTSSSK